MYFKTIHMKTRDLIEMIKNGSKPIIRFTEIISDIDSADEDMMGRVISVSKPDVWERGTETVEFRIDMSEFLEHNRSVAQIGWRDSNGDPVLTWMDSAYYPKDNIETIITQILDDKILNITMSFLKSLLELNIFK